LESFKTFIAVFLALLSAPALAQISVPSAQELETAPVQFKAEVTGNPAFATIERPLAPPGMYPHTGPRDFTGTYFGPGPFKPVPGTPSAPKPTATLPVPVPAQTANRGCLPTFVKGIGGAGYPTHIVSGRDVIIIAHEENHRIRRIYLSPHAHRDNTPTVMGHSVGHFEGDTLVVETTGLQSGEVLHERVRKVDGGRQLEVTVNDVVTLANWRPDLRWVEDICEDAGDLFGPQYEKQSSYQ
jgi:hypothetical protein